MVSTMKKTFIAALALGVCAFGAPAFAELCTQDNVPAATLLLPYFEVDLDNAGGVTTLFSINNASATAVLAHVTLWTDESVPTLDFDVYLTGYDVQTLNIRDIFNGNLPRTASAGQDPGDSISNQGSLSQDINFASCNNSLPYTNPALSSVLLTHIREAHTGGLSPVYGRCAGFDFGDNIARGYITVDTVTQCNLEFPSAPGYFSGIASYQNVLWGDYFFVDSANNFAQGETLVHVEACSNPAVGTGGDDCPFIAGDYTFYGRYVAAAATDQREPLSTMFATRYLNGGAFDGGTNLIVWRDSKTVANTGFTCGSDASWFPLAQTDVVAFDEAENPEDLCFRGDNISPPIGGTDTCFPLEAQRISLTENTNATGTNPIPSFDFGWMYINLNTTVAGGQYGPTAQAYITTVMDANGRFSVGFDAMTLDTACDTIDSGIVLIP
jgi:hypothetical protein